VLLWARSNLELLLIALPEQIRQLPLVQQELQLTALLKLKLPKKQIIGLGSFFVLFCTVGTQVSLLPDPPPFPCPGPYPATLPPFFLSPTLSSPSLFSSLPLGIQRAVLREACDSVVPMDSTEWRVISHATEAITALTEQTP
jgi:hypothetical protein